MTHLRHLMRLSESQPQCLFDQPKHCHDHHAHTHLINISNHLRVALFDLNDLHSNYWEAYLIYNMTTISQAQESPFKKGYRQSDIPLQSIIRQVATPSVLAQDKTLNTQKMVIVNPQGNPQTLPFVYQNSTLPQRVETQAQFIGGTATKIAPIPPEMATLAPIRRVQYVPYEQRYIQYVQQRVKVPVQRSCTDYYQIQHIVDYIPIQKEEIVYEMQPKEIVTMRLQYVPVEQKIIHISDKNAQSLGISNYVNTDLQGKDFVQGSGLYQEVKMNGEGMSGNVSGMRKSRTNFVTSQGYDPQANLQQIDNILNSSRLRASRKAES